MEDMYNVVTIDRKTPKNVIKIVVMAPYTDKFVEGLEVALSKAAFDYKFNLDNVDGVG